ncbi:MAG: hypothetical protein V3S15_04565 [Woeseiaceae bacterium]
MKASKTDFLDRVIPLEGASHADAVEYSVDIPMRYAECFARLADGRIVRLKDRRQFVGWSGWSGARSFLFSNGCQRIEIQVEAMRSADNIRPGHRLHKFITRDGTPLVMRRWARLFVRRFSHRRPAQAIDMPEFHNLTEGVAI